MRRCHLAIFALLSMMGPAGVAGGGEIDDARLLAAASDRTNWLTHGRDYTNQRFSALTQINTSSVARLVPRWIYQSGVAATFQATPIVVDGVMYLSLPFNHVVAIDARRRT